MIMERSSTSAIDKLLSRYLDGSLTVEELAELDDAIQHRVGVAEQTANWFLLHRQTQELTAEEKFSAVVDGVLAGSLSLPPSRSSDAGKKGAAGSAVDRPTPRRVLVVWPAVAAALAAAALLMAVFPSGVVQHNAERHSSASEQPAVIAAVTSLTDAEWTIGRPLGVGDGLVEGDQIALDAGIVKLTYNCGAELLLEGPCEFVVLDAMQGKLCRGKLTADVPPRAFGFGVVSPNTDIIDLGTSFGVSVDEAGETDLQVFDGEVMCAAADFNAQHSPDYQHVRADEAMRFRRRSAPGMGVSPSDDRFETLRRHRRSRTTDDDPLDLGTLALWLNARHGVELDDKGRVAAWADRLTSVNRSGEDAVQPEIAARPLWVESAIGGQPAVRFDGNTDYLTTTPLATTDEQTIVMVLAFGEATYEAGRQWGAQVLNYDGPPSREAAGVVMPGVIQIGESLREREFAPGRPNALAFAGFVGATAVESGRVDAPRALSPGEPVVLTYRYSHSEQTAALWLNGHEVASTRAVAPVAVVSRKIIGRHAWKGLHFNGDLAELRIYNAALDADQMSRIASQLGLDYGITVAGADAQ